MSKDHEFYDNIYTYVAQNLEPHQIAPDLAYAYAERISLKAQHKTFLDEMIYFGKLHYFMDVMLPNKSDEEKIGYTAEQLAWAKANEVNIWAHFIEKELLFSTSSDLAHKFINPAPFSRFGLELDAESPGRIGRYIGWQIVRSYMKNNTVSLDDLMRTGAEDIFNNATFKPRK